MSGIVRSNPAMETAFIIGGAAAVTAAGAGVTANDLNQKEIGAFLCDGTNLKANETTGAAATKLKLAYKDTNGEIHWSPEIPNTAKVRAARYRAGQEQIDYLGFNGSTGSITVTNEFRYEVKVVLRETLNASYDASSLPTFIGSYKSDASATQAEIMNGLYLNLRSNMSTKRNPTILNIERMMAAGSDAAVATGADNFTFTNGSKVVSVTDVDNATGGDALVAGAYLRIGTAATAPVYKIASVDATNNKLVLDAPYNGTTQTIADTGLKQISAANAASLACGLKFTGIAQEWVLDRKIYAKTAWELLEPNGKMTLINSQASNKGVGTYKEVAEMEYYHITDNGSRDKFKLPPNNFVRNLLATDTLTVAGYDIWSISWTDSTLPGVTNMANHTKHVYVCVPTDRGNDAVYADGGVGTGDNDLSDILEGFFNSITAYDENGAALSSNKLEGTA